MVSSITSMFNALSLLSSLRFIRVFNVFSLLTGKIRILLLIGSVLAFIFANIVSYTKGSSNAKVECANAQAKGVMNGEKIYEETKHDIMQLSPTDIDNRLIKWMRD